VRPHRSRHDLAVSYVHDALHVVDRRALREPQQQLLDRLLHLAAKHEIDVIDGIGQDLPVQKRRQRTAHHRHDLRIHVLGDRQRIQRCGDTCRADGTGHWQVIEAHDDIRLESLDLGPDVLEGATLGHCVVDARLIARVLGGRPQVGELERQPRTDDLHAPAVIGRHDEEDLAHAVNLRLSPRLFCTMEPITPRLRAASRPAGRSGRSGQVKRPGFHVGSIMWKPRSPGRLPDYSGRALGAA